ncbi:MAG: Bax inhibitor-1 family protein [Lachnospiraceae bacterium]|nr:Bax inhibitor-1 family protein [Lachnospiraceae bacterium]
MDNKKIKAARLLELEGVEITSNIYNMILGGTLLWGVLVNLLMAVFLQEPILRLPYWATLVIYLVGSLGCSFVIYKSNQPVVSFLGFTGLSISMGILITYYVTFFEASDVRKAYFVTAGVTLLMMLVSSIYPAFFRSLGKTLFIALVGVLIGELVLMLFGMYPNIFDWIYCLIFCGYVGYDWAVAQSYPPTVDHAIDSAADIYVDVVNLFIRILSLMGRRND